MRRLHRKRKDRVRLLERVSALLPFNVGSRGTGYALAGCSGIDCA